MKEYRSGYAVSLYPFLAAVHHGPSELASSSRFSSGISKAGVRPFELPTAAELFELYKFTSLLTFAEVF